jgi:hypothetical protein
LSALYAPVEQSKWQPPQVTFGLYGVVLVTGLPFDCNSGTFICAIASEKKASTTITVRAAMDMPDLLSFIIVSPTL